MKTFAGNKSLTVIQQQCQAAGLTYDQSAFERGSDFVRISAGGAHVLYSTFNGRFFGQTPDGIRFSSDSTAHESEDWFQALLSFFYVERETVLH